MVESNNRILDILGHLEILNRHIFCFKKEDMSQRKSCVVNLSLNTTQQSNTSNKRRPGKVPKSKDLCGLVTSCSYSLSSYGCLFFTVSMQLLEQQVQLEDIT